jgi:hypothetical protein
MKISILKETIKKVDGKYVVYPKKGGKRLGTHDTLEGAKKQLAAIEISKARNEGQIEEISAMSGGAVGGFSGDKEEIDELLSTSGQKGMIRIRISRDDKEHEGHVERSKHQGLRNVMEDDSEPEVKYVRKGTIFKLSDLADKRTNASRVFDVLNDVVKSYGLDKLKETILKDSTAGDRIGAMETDFGYDSGMKEKIESGDEEAIKKYYQFLINEFMYWIKNNPRASAAMYSGRKAMLSKPTKDLAFGMTARYISDPNKNNPRSLAGRLADEAEFYKLDPDLESSLYNLPE